MLYTITKKIDGTLYEYEILPEFSIVSAPNDCTVKVFNDFETWATTLAQHGIIVEAPVVEKTPEEEFQELVGQLNIAKENKRTEIKETLDRKNTEAIVDTQAAMLDAEGNVTDELFYFKFYTNRHPTNPASDPTALLTNCVIANKSIFYSTRKTTGEKITVEITPEMAVTLSAHIADRNNGNYRLRDAIERVIDAASTLQEVAAITWDTKYLDPELQS